jgi:hypothetical protein
MRLRERIEKIINSNTDPAQAAIQVCLMLEDKLDLDGNGWWDDDEIIKAAFKEQVEAWNNMTNEQQLEAAKERFQ